MTQIVEGQLAFDFPQGLLATKYDEWDFYRHRFIGMLSGIKAVDIIYVDGTVTWLIEVKDYRRNRRTKPSELADEVAKKVFDTLAGLATARFNADPDERTSAKKALRTDRLRVVLHLEQPANPSRLFPQSIDPAKLKQKLKQVLKPVDAHPRVVNMVSLKPDMTWTVTGV
jgi:hypothetical protein